MTKEQLQEIFNEYVLGLKQKGYDVPIVVLDSSWSAKRTYGQCVTEDGFFTIQISKIHYENAPEDRVRNTVLHELTHAVDRNKNGHSAKWKKLVAEIGPKFNQVITRTGALSIEEAEAKKEIAVAKLTCSKCGQVSLLYRRVGAYKTEGEGYYCGYCGKGTKLLFEKYK